MTDAPALQIHTAARVALTHTNRPTRAEVDAAQREAVFSILDAHAERVRAAQERHAAERAADLAAWLAANPDEAAYRAASKHPTNQSREG